MSSDRPAPAARPLRVLLVEDNPTDAEIVIRALRTAGFEGEFRRVETEEAFLAALEPQPDLILSDYSLPRFDGFSALQLLRGRGLDLPFILISGTLGEELAVTAIKRGADDYLLKDHLARLGSAVEHALEAKRMRDAARAAEEKLRVSEARLRAIVENEPECVKVVSVDGRLLDMNPAGLRMIEAGDGAAVLGQPVISLIHPEDREAFAGLHRRVAAGEGGRLQFRIRGLRGTERWMDTHATPLRDSAGVVTAVLSVTRDISERKRVEEELGENRRRLSAIVETTPTLIVLADATGRILLFNRACESLTGYRRDEALGRTIAELLLPAEWIPVVQERFRDPASPAVTEPHVSPWRTKSGELRMIEWRCTPLPSSGAGGLDILGTGIDITERLQAEQTLRDSEERHRLLFMSNPLPGWVYDLETLRFLAVNDAAVEKYGYTREEFLARTIRDIRPTEDVPALLQSVSQVTTGLSHGGVWRHRLKDGRVILVEITSHVLDFGGRRAELVLAADVTERHRAQESLRTSEERFRLLARAANDAVWDWDLLTDALWWNEGFEILFGFQRTEIEPTIESWTSRVHPEDLEAIVADVQRAIDSGAESWSGEYRFRRKDGSYAYVLDRGHVIRDTAGRAVRMIGGMTDLTERRGIEERLRNQASLLDASQDAIFVRDLTHRIIYCNQSAERLYGWGAGELIGRSSRELFYADPAPFDEAMQLLLSQGHWSGQLTQLRRDGEKIDVEARWTLVRDAGGNPKSVLVINTDVTERRKLEQQFFRAQRMESIGTLAGGIAHDLNNLLSPIMMGVELLKRYEPQPKSLPVIDNIERSAQRGADLVKQVLSFARGVEGTRVNLSVGRLVGEVRSIMESTFPKDIVVESSVSDDTWLVQGDPTQLTQVLMNLCLNARDAMPGSGRLGITTANCELDEQYSVMNRGVVAGRYVRIEVVDTGSGIPRHIIDRVFEPFFTTKEMGKGTGLGLSTVLGIVRSHGGFINVYSEPGHGSTFKVYLPAASDPGPEGGAEAAGEKFPRGRGELILVVDDEASILNITRQTLEAFGYRALTAEDGAQAIGLFALKRREIAVVLTDMAMPVMDGPALISALKRIEPGIRVIASSGLNANGHVAKAASAGVKHFLPKPYSASAILTTLRQVLAET